MWAPARRVQRIRLSAYLGPDTDSLGVWLTTHRSQDPNRTPPVSDRLSVSFLGDPCDPYAIMVTAADALIAQYGGGPSRLV